MSKVDYTDLEFDEEKYYLGTLCKRGHDWNGTGRSLRILHERACGCIECMRIATIKWRSKNKKHLKEYNKKNYYKNRERNLKQMKRWREKNKDYHKFLTWKWRIENKEYLREKNAEYYYANIDTISEKYKKYYQKNRKKILESCRKWQVENKDRLREYNRKYHIENKERERIRFLLYLYENRGKLYAYKKKWHKDNLEWVKLYNQMRRQWKEVMRLVDESNNDVLAVWIREQIIYLSSLQTSILKAYREKNWKEYFMRVRNMIEVHGEHLEALINNEERRPQFLLKSINRAANTQLATLREERKEVVTNAFNHPDRTPEFIDLSS